MPLYDYRCPEHGYFDGYADMAHSSEPAACPACGQASPKVILHAPRVFGDWEGFESPATGEWVEGRKARREDMLRSGCREWEGLESELRARAARERVAEAEVDEQIEEAVERAVGELRSN